MWLINVNDVTTNTNINQVLRTNVHFVAYCMNVTYNIQLLPSYEVNIERCRRRRYRMIVSFITTCAISAYHHYSCDFEPHFWRCVLDTTLWDNVCQWLVTGRWFSPGTLVSFTNKTDCHNIAEIFQMWR